MTEAMGSDVEVTQADREKAAELAGCVLDDYPGAPFCAAHDELGNPPWHRCRWVPIAQALADERAKARAPLSVPELRTAQATQKPCELYAHTDSPHPSRTQYHHRHPVYLQNRVYGEIRDAAGDKMIWLCGLCHDSVHDAIGWLLGETRKPDPMPGRNAIAEAKRTVAWYLNATNGGTA